MDKDEILRKTIPTNCWWEDNLDNVPKHYVETAMDKWAKQQAILFAIYCNDNWLYRTGDKWSQSENPSYAPKSDEEVYDEFFKSNPFQCPPTS